MKKNNIKNISHIRDVQKKDWDEWHVLWDAYNKFYVVGMIMAAGQLIGSRIGAYLVLEKGVALVRPLYLFVVTMMTLLLFVKMY